MPGLMPSKNNLMQEGRPLVGAGRAGLGAPTGAGGQVQKRQADPAQQAMYDQAVSAAYSLIYSDEGMDAALQTIQASRDPIEGVANAIATVMTRVQDAASKSGRRVPSDVMVGAIKEVTEDMADMLKENGQIDLMEDGQINNAYMKAIERFRSMENQAGLTDEAEAQRDIEGFKQAQEAGALDKMLPEVSRLAGGA